MKVIDIFPKDVHVVTENSAREIVALRDALKGARFFPDGDAEKESCDIVANKLYPEIVKLAEELENGS